MSLSVCRSSMLRPRPNSLPKQYCPGQLEIINRYVSCAVNEIVGKIERRKDTVHSGTGRTTCAMESVGVLPPTVACWQHCPSPSRLLGRLQGAAAAVIGRVEAQLGRAMLRAEELWVRPPAVLAAPMKATGTKGAKGAKEAKGAKGAKEKGSAKQAGNSRRGGASKAAPNRSSQAAGPPAKRAKVSAEVSIGGAIGGAVVDLGGRNGLQDRHVEHSWNVRNNRTFRSVSCDDAACTTPGCPPKTGVTANPGAEQSSIAKRAGPQQPTACTCCASSPCLLAVDPSRPTAAAATTGSTHGKMHCPGTTAGRAGKMECWPGWVKQWGRHGAGREARVSQHHPCRAALQRFAFQKQLRGRIC